MQSDEEPTAEGENTYYFEEVEVDDDDDDEGVYKEVSDIDSDLDDDDEEENFDNLFSTLANIDAAPVEPASPENKTRPKKAGTTQKPVVVDDFIRYVYNT